VFLQRVRNQGMSLGTLFDRAAERHPDSAIVLDHDLDIAPRLGRRMTFRDVADLVDDIASRLSATGIRQGDHVVVHKTDGFDVTLLGLATARIGAVPVLLSPQLAGDVVAELLTRVPRPVLLTDARKLERDLPGVVFERSSQVLLAAGAHAGAVELSSLAGAPRVPAVAVPPDAPALVTHTSGTTGVPKLAVHTSRTFEARYRPQALLARLVRRSEPVAIHVSFTHSRLMTAMPIAILHGHDLVVRADDDPETVADVFSAHRPGLIEAHPNSFMRWEELADDPRQPLARVKVFSSTFDAIHPRTVHCLLGASRRRAPKFMQIYGQSEVGPVAGRTYSRKRGAETDARCVGFPMPGMTAVRVASGDGKRPTKSSPGPIEVQTDGRIVTYLGEPERYAEQDSDGWWRMGDVGYRTRWGCLHLLDREVDVIPGIESTLEVEDTLLTRLPELAEVILVHGRDDRAIPVVCVRDDAPLDRAAWATAVADLPSMAEPVQLRADELPQTATTKVRRIELARVLARRGRRDAVAA
jgi:acyl-coenzyme A synthetase/AMP-(fatty) acid ligase